MSMTYPMFRRQVLAIDGVTYVGPPHLPWIGVETEQDLEDLRPHVDPAISIFVTGPIEAPEAPAGKHPGVQMYEKVQEETKP